MNTVKQRLENRTRTAIAALEHLAELNAKGADYSDLDIEKVQAAIQASVENTLEKLRSRPDLISFSLK